MLGHISQIATDETDQQGRAIANLHKKGKKRSLSEYDQQQSEIIQKSKTKILCVSGRDHLKTSLKDLSQTEVVAALDDPDDEDGKKLF